MRQQIQVIGGKHDRLMEAYLDQSISLEEYKPTKNRLVEEKQLLKEKLTTLEKNNGNWFEPARRFVKALQEAKLGAEQGTEIEKRDLLKKIGSNLTISNRHLSVVPRKEWQLVVDQGVFAQRTTAPEIFGAVYAGENQLYLNQRRGRDSNSRSGLSPIQHFQCCSFSRSDTSPKTSAANHRRFAVADKILADSTVHASPGSSNGTGQISPRLHDSH